MDLAQAAHWHRQIAALVEAADRAGVAGGKLPAIRDRLVAQQSRFTEWAARRGSPLPALVPTPAEVAMAASALGDLSDTAVARAVQTVTATLDAADAALGATTTAPPASHTAAGPASTDLGAVEPSRRATAGPAARNAVIYGGYAFFVLVVQLVLLTVLDEQRTLPTLAPLCLGVLPAFAWVAGWLTIAVVSPAARGASTVTRSPRLGAIICLLPDVALCAGVGILFLAR